VGAQLDDAVLFRGARRPARAALEAIPGKVCDEIARESNPIAVQKLFEDALREALLSVPGGENHEETLGPHETCEPNRT
jgi:hypothetical protein